MDEASELGGKILREVSRSFYLSLRVLPRGFRGPASLGYLLARISDTLADTEAVPVAERVEALEGFCRLLEGEGNRAGFQGRVEEVFLRRQTHEGERVLLKNSAACVAWLERVPDWQGGLIRTLLGHITEGQRWDLQRFGGEGVVRLDRDEELERYAYLVAGSVGEFWTDLGRQLDPDYSELPQKELREMGRNYGMGLQLVNILRDVPEDLAKGRCYLPGDGGTASAELLAAMVPWREKAGAWLKEGVRYAGSVRGRRVRLASGLPALIGLRTLELLHTADWADLEARVKVTRPDVRRIAWRAFAASLAPGPERWSA